jgi:hypothetical protein
MALAFVPRRDGRFYLLARHRQPLPENIAAHFIEQYTQPNDLIVDPFAASDAVVRAALERGRRILASETNPIVAWATRVQATLPNARDLNAALGRLGDTRKEGDSLKAATEKLYASQCAQCGGMVTVDYFVWRRDGSKSLLAAKVYTCSKCGDRHDDAAEADRQRVQAYDRPGLSYHLLVQKLLADDPANTPHIKRLLELYTPRNLNALAGITQKLDAEFRDNAPGQSDVTRNLVSALLLHALDVGSSLYPSPDGMPTRSVPDEFIEVNVWRAMEQAACSLGERPAAPRLASKPEQVIKSSTPAAFIAQGGARFLAENAPAAQAALMLSSPARLDPMFWELSFLWTRWLLGKNAAAPLEPLLDSKRQRWGWYGDALTKSVADAAKLLRPNAPAVIAFPSGSHAMIEALLLAASPVFDLNDFAFRPERGADRTTEWGALRGDYQVVLKRIAESNASSANPPPAGKIRSGALQGARDILSARGEPLAYSWLHHAALVKLAQEGTLQETLSARYRESDNAFQYLRHRMEEGFKEGYVQEIDHWEQDGRVLWMRRQGEQQSDADTDLAARVETFVRRLLEAEQRISVDAFEDRVLAEFSGLLTPEIELVEICARAYAEQRNGEWLWREQDVNAELQHARALTRQLGEQLGVQVVDAPPQFEMIWRTERVIPGSASGSMREERIYEDEYAFLFRERLDFAELSRFRAAPLRGLVVIPEQQVELTRERLRRDPRWLKALERAGWQFLRVPMLELLLSEEHATRPEFRLAWGLEPPLAGGQEQLHLL